MLGSFIYKKEEQNVISNNTFECSFDGSSLYYSDSYFCGLHKTRIKIVAFLLAIRKEGKR